MALTGGSASCQVPGSTREGARNGFPVVPPPSGILSCFPVAKSPGALLKCWGA